MEAANILNKHSRVADKGWTFSLEAELRPKNSPPEKAKMLRNATQVLGLRPWCRWEDNIKMDLREIGREVAAGLG
jgi:hypothetical protein